MQQAPGANRWDRGGQARRCKSASLAGVRGAGAAVYMWPSSASILSYHPERAAGAVAGGRPGVASLRSKRSSHRPMGTYL